MDAAQIIRRLAAEYDSGQQAYNAACDLEDTLPGGGEKEAAKLAVSHAVRQMRSLRLRLASVPSPDARSLALKARVVSTHLQDIWDGDEAQTDEVEALQQLLPDMLQLGQVAPVIPFGRDLAAQDLVNTIKPASVSYPVTETAAATATSERDGRSLLQQLAEEAGELHGLYNEYDEKTLCRESPPIKREAERLRDMARDRLDTIALLGSAQQAQTPSEAMFQLMLAYEGMVVMDATDDDGSQRKVDRHIAASCMYSVARYLERTAGISRHSFGGGAVMPDRMDPFTRRNMPKEVTDPFPPKAA
jgi:hypothetical protein